MSKRMKQAMITHLTRTLDEKDSGIVIGAGVLSVAETEALRRRLRTDGVHLLFLRNNLASVAFEKGRLKGLDRIVKGPTALAFGGDGAIAIAKLLVDEATKIKKLTILGGIIDGEVLDSAGVAKLSKMPGKKELQSMVLQSIASPINGFHGAMSNLFTEVHGLISALEKKQTEGATA